MDILAERRKMWKATADNWMNLIELLKKHKANGMDDEYCNSRIAYALRQYHHCMLRATDGATVIGDIEVKEPKINIGTLQLSADDLVLANEEIAHNEKADACTN